MVRNWYSGYRLGTWTGLGLNLMSGEKMRWGDKD